MRALGGRRHEGVEGDRAGQEERAPLPGADEQQAHGARGDPAPDVVDDRGGARLQRLGQRAREVPRHGHDDQQCDPPSVEADRVGRAVGRGPAGQPGEPVGQLHPAEPVVGPGDQVVDVRRGAHDGPGRRGEPDVRRGRRSGVEIEEPGVERGDAVARRTHLDRDGQTGARVDPDVHPVHRGGRLGRVDPHAEGVDAGDPAGADPAQFLLGRLRQQPPAQGRRQQIGRPGQREPGHVPPGRGRRLEVPGPGAGRVPVQVRLPGGGDDVDPVLLGAAPPDPHRRPVAEQVGDLGQLVRDREGQAARGDRIPGEGDTRAVQDRPAQVRGRVTTVGRRERPDDERQGDERGDQRGDGRPARRSPRSPLRHAPTVGGIGGARPGVTPLDGLAHVAVGGAAAGAPLVRQCNAGSPAQPGGAVNRVDDDGRMQDVTAVLPNLYDTALHSMGEPDGHQHWYTRALDGARYPLSADLRRWCAAADATDRALLARTTGTVLDVGCGPGRLVAELERLGRQAAGLDTSRAAVRLTRRSGGAALRRSVFDPVPGEGTWDTVLLADGNIGIGGDPVALLARCRELVAPGGQVVVELAPAGTGLRVDRVRMERLGDRGPWFDWAQVGTDAVDSVADDAGLRVTGTWERSGRCFAVLAPTADPARAATAVDDGTLELAS